MDKNLISAEKNRIFHIKTSKKGINIFPDFFILQHLRAFSLQSSNTRSFSSLAILIRVKEQRQLIELTDQFSGSHNNLFEKGKRFLKRF
jgi:hypothetical protein